MDPRAIYGPRMSMSRISQAELRGAGLVLPAEEVVRQDVSVAA